MAKLVLYSAGVNRNMHIYNLQSHFALLPGANVAHSHRIMKKRKHKAEDLMVQMALAHQRIENLG